jgi:hypothetical protein
MNKTPLASLPEEFPVFVQPVLALEPVALFRRFPFIEPGTPHSDLPRGFPSPSDTTRAAPNLPSERRRLAIPQQVDPFIGTTRAFAEKCDHDGEPDRTNDNASSSK